VIGVFYRINEHDNHSSNMNWFYVKSSEDLQMIPSLKRISRSIAWNARYYFDMHITNADKWYGEIQKGDQDGRDEYFDIEDLMRHSINIFLMCKKRKPNEHKNYRLAYVHNNLKRVVVT